MASGAGDSFSRRRWTSASSLLISVTLCFMFHCAICLLPVRFLWLFGGRRSRQTLRRRQELRIFAVLLPAVLSLRLVLPPAMSREDSLAAAKLWSSGLYPVVPLSGDFVQAFQLRMEHRSKLMNSTSSSSEGRESHQPPCAAPPHLNGARSYSITSPDPSLIGKTPISPSCKVMLYSPPGCLRDSGSFPLRLSSSGGLSLGVEEHLRSKASWLVRTTFIELMSLNDWAWPICLMKLVSLPRPSPIKENSIQISVAFHAWVSVSKIPGGISPCYLFSYLSNGMNLLVKSPTSVLFQSTSSEEKVSPSCPLPMDRGVSSDSFPSVCFSSLIGLLSCGAVSTGPEDANETTSVVFVDEVWTSTSLYVTIFQSSDFVVKVPSTHSSIVLNSLSSSVEDLSCLAYIYVVVYAYCLRGCLIPSFYCSEED
ncbi:BnaA08g25230D [Brassica napus]|uniref:BnaA08g25230D protein n=1 Tax=Brassica napus TaxID=3708 RepID=A0A078G7K1_BRANA|nr:BnaA08g25230D [Brassica napus]